MAGEGSGRPRQQRDEAIRGERARDVVGLDRRRPQAKQKQQRQQQQRSGERNRCIYRGATVAPEMLAQALSLESEQRRRTGYEASRVLAEGSWRTLSDPV